MRPLDPSRPWRSTIVRHSPAAGFLLLGILTLWLIQMTDFSFSGRPLWEMFWCILLTDLAAYISLRVLSRSSLDRQAIVVFLVVATQAALFGSLRIDGFQGDGRPIVAWRWTPSWEASWQRKQQAIPHADRGLAEPDLATTTPFDWPAFRGSRRDGVVAAGPSLSRDWTVPPKLLWRHPIGAGWSSFAVVGNYCVTQEQRGDFEAVVCYELSTGREVWEHRDRACFREFTGGIGPRSTPAIHNGRVFSLGATGILNALDGRSGRSIWSTNILDDAHVENRIFGMSGSPLILDDLVVVSPGGTGSSLVAYDQATGRRAWRGGDAAASYSSPHFAEFNPPQILSFNAEGLFAHDAQDGDVLWSFPWISNPSERNNVCQPVPLPGRDAAPDRVFIASGYGQGCAMLRIEPRGRRFVASQQWRTGNLNAKFSSVVRRNGFVYGLDERILVCLDLATGTRCWKGGRYGYGQLLLVDDLLLVQTEAGDVVLVEASPRRHRELGRFTAMSSRTWNQPVIVGKLLLLRNDREAACFELPVELGVGSWELDLRFQI